MSVVEVIDENDEDDEDEDGDDEDEDMDGIEDEDMDDDDPEAEWFDEVGVSVSLETGFLSFNSPFCLSRFPG